MNKEFLKMQKLAGLITESQYKKKLSENKSSFDRNAKAFGILFKKATPKDDYNDGRGYTWIENNVYKFVESLGYEGQEAHDVASEFMAFAAPGSTDEAYALELNPKTFNPKMTTLGMYADSISDSYPNESKKLSENEDYNPPAYEAINDLMDYINMYSDRKFTGHLVPYRSISWLPGVSSEDGNMDVLLYKKGKQQVAIGADNVYQDMDDDNSNVWVIDSNDPNLDFGDEHMTFDEVVEAVSNWLKS